MCNLIIGPSRQLFTHLLKILVYLYFNFKLSKQCISINASLVYKRSYSSLSIRNWQASSFSVTLHERVCSFHYSPLRQSALCAILNEGNRPTITSACLIFASTSLKAIQVTKMVCQLV
uniref:Uncharacterized protein n=1 Tax=Gossypium raimondii TaxID=29730 RepID=A0A0D2U4D7_GOSRA|nr:hypothetical protein B456_010G017200 [Gossypium raimondii]